MVFLELFLAFGDRWAGWAQAAVFVGCVALGVAAFALINRVRGRRLVQLPDRVGVLEIVLYLVLPAVPTAIGSQNAVAENVLVVVVFNVLVLLVAFVVTSWGLLPMIRWSIWQLKAQIGDIANLTMKSLPILLIFSAFIFLNAEMWQVANDFTLPYFAAVAVLVVSIGSGFVMLSVRRLTVDLARFERWSDVRKRSADTPVEQMVPGDEEPAPRRAEVASPRRVQRCSAAVCVPSNSDPVGGVGDHRLLRVVRSVDGSRRHVVAVDHGDRTDQQC